MCSIVSPGSRLEGEGRWPWGGSADRSCRRCRGWCTWRRGTDWRRDSPAAACWSNHTSCSMFKQSKQCLELHVQCQQYQHHYEKHKITALITIQKTTVIAQTHKRLNVFSQSTTLSPLWLFARSSPIDVKGRDNLGKCEVLCDWLGHAHLINAQHGVGGDDGAAREVDTLAHQVPADSPLFALQSLLDRLQRPTRLLRRLSSTAGTTLSRYFITTETYNGSTCSQWSYSCMERLERGMGAA